MSVLPEESEGYVYYIKLRTDQGAFYKIGFTRRESVEKRFSYGGSENYKLVEKVFMHKYSMYAYDIEQLLHHQLLYRHKAYKKGAFTSLFTDLAQHPLFKDGQTELYKYDVLGLDNGATSPLGFMRSNKTDLVRKRRLDLGGLVGTAEQDIKARVESAVYEIVDELIEPPLIETKQQYTERKGDWVVSLNRWARKNCADSFYRPKTSYGTEPFPKTSAELKRLKIFHPVWAYVDSIPKEIGHLSNLEKIECRSTDIDEIPDALYGLEQLRELNLNGCGITHISPEIKNLSSLEILNLSMCDRLMRLPDELFELKNLKRLDLSFSSIDSLPANIQNLSSLEVISVFMCKNLDSLPIEIEQMPNLKEIQICSDQQTLVNCLPNKSHLFV